MGHPADTVISSAETRTIHASKTKQGDFMSRKSLVPIIAAAVALTLLGLTQLSAQVSPESMDTARQAKSTRYDGGGCDLTVPGRDCFFEHFAPGAIPLIPLKESAFALLGTVTKVQPYLSADRTHIYTETTIQIEEVFKSPETFNLPPDRTLITDQIGGSMRMNSDRVIHDGSVVDFIGKTYVGGRDVVFLRQVHEGKDLAILKAYQLPDGKVFKLTEDGSPGKVLLSKTPNKADSLSDEQEFLPPSGNMTLWTPRPGICIRRSHWCAGVRLDKSEGAVKDKDIPGSAEHRFALPERLRTKALEISR